MTSGPPGRNRVTKGLRGCDRDADAPLQPFEGLPRTPHPAALISPELDLVRKRFAGHRLEWFICDCPVDQVPVAENGQHQRVRQQEGDLAAVDEGQDGLLLQQRARFSRALRPPGACGAENRRLERRVHGLDVKKCDTELGDQVVLKLIRLCARGSPAEAAVSTPRGTGSPSWRKRPRRRGRS